MALDLRNESVADIEWFIEFLENSRFSIEGNGDGKLPSLYDYTFAISQLKKLVAEKRLAN